MDRVPFHQRMGVVAAPMVGLQEMPRELRVALWNTFQHWLFSDDVPGMPRDDQARHVFTYLGWPADEARFHGSENRNRLKEWFFKTSWDRVYDFVEWLPYLLAKADPGPYDRHRIVAFGKEYMVAFDRALSREGSPYRLVNAQLIPITDNSELSEVEVAMNAPFAGARAHIAQAARLLSMKPEPDYRNCIKESVSAIESMLMEATGLRKGDLPVLIKSFEQTHGPLHPAFRSAVSSLYGWTSDEKGVRHGIFGDINVDHADARFMLVTCSAFVNFLIQRVKAP